MSQDQEVESINLALQTPKTNHFISKSRSNVHVDSSNRLEVPQGYSPQLFNIEIKKHEENSPKRKSVSPNHFQQNRNSGYPFSMSRQIKIKSMKAPKNYDPFKLIRDRERKIAKLDIIVKPLEYFSEKELVQKDRAASQEHSHFINTVIEKYSLYTSVKQIPAALICEHKNQVDTFKRNFIAGSTFQKTGYVSEDDKLASKSKAKQAKTIEKAYETDVGKKEKQVFVTKRDLRDVIEKHARFIRMQKKKENQFSSPRSVQLKNSKALVTSEFKQPDQISLKHNKPLPGMLSLNQTVIKERKDQQQKQNEILGRIKNRDHKIKLKELSSKHMTQEFITKLSQGTPTKGTREVDEITRTNILNTVSSVNRKFQPLAWTRKVMPSQRILSKEDNESLRSAKTYDEKYAVWVRAASQSVGSSGNFEQKRRLWENALEQGQILQSDDELKQFPLKKKVKPLLSCLHEREQQRLHLAKQRRAFLFKMRVQGINDEAIIERELAKLEWDIKLQIERKKKERGVINDPAKMSINLSKLMYESDNNYGSANQLEQDFEGVETGFKFQTRSPKKDKLQVAPLTQEERSMRIAKARERLRTRKIYQEDIRKSEPMLNLAINTTKRHDQKINKEVQSKLEFSVGKNTQPNQNFQPSQNQITQNLNQDEIFQPDLTDSNQFNLVQEQNEEIPQKLSSKILQKTILQVKKMLQEKKFQYLKHLEFDLGQAERPQTNNLNEQNDYKDQNTIQTNPTKNEGEIILPEGHIVQSRLLTSEGTRVKLQDLQFAGGFNPTHLDEIQESDQKQFRGKTALPRARIPQAMRLAQTNYLEKESDPSSQLPSIVNDKYPKGNLKIHGQVKSSYCRVSHAQKESGQRSSSNQGRTAITFYKDTITQTADSLNPRNMHSTQYLTAKPTLNQEDSDNMQSLNNFGGKQNSLGNKMSHLNLQMDQTNYASQPHSRQYVVQSQGEEEIQSQNHYSIRQSQAPSYQDNTDKPLNETNRSMSGMFDIRQQRYGSHLQRLRQLKANRIEDSYYQTNLMNNIEAYQFKKLQSVPSFQDQLDDVSRQGLLLKQELREDQNLDNRFVSSCPYYGLYKIRENQEKPINYQYRDDVILRSMLVTKNQLPPSVKKAVTLKNLSTKMDLQVHQIIELCEETVKIPWREIFKKQPN